MQLIQYKCQFNMWSVIIDACFEFYIPKSATLLYQISIVLADSRIFLAFLLYLL